MDGNCRAISDDCLTPPTTIARTSVNYVQGSVVRSEVCGLCSFISRSQLVTWDLMNVERVPKRTRQACDPCRRKKSKCSGDRPVCGTCGRLGHRCTYPTEYYGPPRQEAAAEGSPQQPSPQSSGATPPVPATSDRWVRLLLLPDGDRYILARGILTCA